MGSSLPVTSDMALDDYERLGWHPPATKDTSPEISITGIDRQEIGFYTWNVSLKIWFYFLGQDISDIYIGCSPETNDLVE